MRRFIRYFWISRYPLVTEKRLFKTIKKVTTEWDKLLGRLWDASDDYNKLLDGNKDVWIDLDSRRGPDLFRSVSALRHMGVMQCYVFLLSVLRNYDKLGTDPRRIFQLIEKFSFNYAAVCKLPANKVESLYSRYANKLEDAVNNSAPKKRSGNIDRVFSNLESELKDLRPPYELFKNRFMEISYGSYQKTRLIITYILEKIERLKCTGEKTTDFDLVNIEHILPRNPSKAWGLVRKDIKEYVNKLGNLTLVHRDFNSKAGNKSLKYKLKEFEDTEMMITRELTERIKDSDYKWEEEDIIQRQEEFTYIAYHKVWNY
jgi:hypothetical protein